MLIGEPSKLVGVFNAVLFHGESSPRFILWRGSVSSVYVALTLVIVAFPVIGGCVRFVRFVRVGRIYV